MDGLSALYQAFWVDGKAVQKTDELRSVLVEALGEKLAQEVMEKVSESHPATTGSLRSVGTEHQRRSQEIAGGKQ